MTRIFYPLQPRLISITQPLFSQLDKDKKVIAELKYNGDHLILKRETGRFEFWTRHGEPFKRYRPTQALEKKMEKLKWNGFCVCDGELLHFKSTAKKHTIVLFDVLVWNGEFLDKKFSERRSLLVSLFAGQKFDDLFYAQHWCRDFKTVFDAYTNLFPGLIEGLVLKHLDGKLKPLWRSGVVADWMWKVRKPSGRYHF